MSSRQVRVEEETLAAVRRRFPEADCSDTRLVNRVLWWVANADAPKATFSLPVKANDEYQSSSPKFEIDSLEELTADEVEF